LRTALSFLLNMWNTHVRNLIPIKKSKKIICNYLKNVRRGRIREYAEKYSTATYYEGKRPWGLVPAEVALPSATQNEISGDDANALVENGCLCVSEGSNMPSTPEAVEVFLNNKVLRIWYSGKLCEWG
jgi:glutamate dehydrogenase/leucine dehydrogenase